MPRPSACLLVLACVAAVTPALAQTDRLLELNKPIERELAGDEAHSYQFSLAAGQYAQVAVDQRRINVAVSVYDPAGAKLVEADMFRTGDPELVSLFSDASATYRIEVRAVDAAAARGSYEIKVAELRLATEQDKSAVAAERLVAEAVLLDTRLTADTWRKAIDKYQQSIPLWQTAKNQVWEARALYLIGAAYISLGERQKAFDFSNQAVQLAQVAAQGSGKQPRNLSVMVEAEAFDTLGRAHNEFGDKQKALEVFKQALVLRQSNRDRVGEVITLNNMAMAYQFMGDYQQALDLMNQIHPIVKEIGDRAKEGSVLNNMCVLLGNVGEHGKALESCNSALGIRRELHEASATIVLNNIGVTYANLGDYQKALDSYTQVRLAHKAAGNPQGEAIALSNIGYVYASLGESQQAIDFYQQALEIFRKVGDPFREANTLSNIAASYAEMKDFRKALEINLKVLPIRHSQRNQNGEAVTLNNIAGCYSNLGEKQKALDYFNQSIALQRTLGNVSQLATSLRNVGALYRDLGDYQKALDYLNEALQISRTVGDRHQEAGVLAHIARVERDQGHLIEAKNRIDESMAAVESVRIRVTSQQLRASFLASVRSYHELNIDLLMRLNKAHPGEGFDAAAFQASEKGRARSLLELLTEAHADIREGVDPALLERERTLRKMISDKAERQMRLLSGRHSEEQAASAAKEINALATDHEQIEAQIRQTSPRYAALTAPVPLTLKEIQSQVLDDETLLLEYSLGEERSFLWAVTRDGLHSFELAKRTEIEQVARQVHELLIAYNQSIPNEAPEQRRRRLEQADAEYPKASAALSRILLGPVASELGNKRLLIVSDGMLQYVPFAALPSPAPGEPQPLIVNNEVISLPSASVLAVLRQEAAGRTPGSKMLAVFADPVYSSSDPRVSQSGRDRSPVVETTSLVADAKRSAEEAGLSGLVRLRFSRLEADEITRLAADNMKLEALDFAASRDLATSAGIGQYRMVHFATHALINPRHPELSGVVLSLVDNKGREQNGFLRLYDVYNLKLGADLVVLSGCQTALGKDVNGEGLIGLTRGFMYAGASRVVASLWRVDDRATAELMKRFYQGMLGQGLRPPAALRAAQVSFWKDKRWQAPQYWAAFTIQGDWR